MRDQFGAIVRGDVHEPQVALIFTGHDLSEGTRYILQRLKRNNIIGSFFLTGDYLRNRRFKPLVRQMVKEGHYVSVHSDKHLLTNDWSNRDSLLVSKDSFLRDLNDNYLELEKLGIKKSDAQFYVPPYEWYNRQTLRWSEVYGLIAVNYTPGIRTAADYTYPEMGGRYWKSDAILDNFWIFEEQNGLNGFIILVHMGTDERRKDKFYRHLDRIIAKLKGKGYRFVDVPQLLK